MKKIFLLLLVALTVSCKKKQSDEASSVTPVWYALRQNPTDVANVIDGKAYLSTSFDASKQNTGVSLGSLQKLKGDFELRIDFSSFLTSGTGAMSDLMGFSLLRGTDSQPMITSILTNTQMYLEDKDLTTYEMKATTGREGEFYVKRVGADFTTWFRVGQDTVSMSKTNYATEDMEVHMYVNSLDNTTKHTSLLIDDVLIKGGGGALTSDTFDNNTIVIYR